MAQLVSKLSDMSTEYVSVVLLYTGFPRLMESPGFFFLENSRTWKVLENHFGPGKSWKLKLKVLESPGKISLKALDSKLLELKNF